MKFVIVVVLVYGFCFSLWAAGIPKNQKGSMKEQILKIVYNSGLRIFTCLDVKGQADLNDFLKDSTGHH
jgi:hypothetical protein